MKISHRVRFRLWALAAAGLAVAGCSQTGAFLIRGDADSAEIGYTGDLAGATLLARSHCRQYERVPRLSDVALESVFFDCVRPGAAVQPP